MDTQSPPAQQTQWLSITWVMSGRNASHVWRSKSRNSGATLLTVAGSGGGGIAIDGADNAWVTDITSTAVRGLSNSGSPISGTFGYNAGVLLNPVFLALDGSGDIWVADESQGTNSGFGLSELIGAAVPVVTPIATGVKNNTLGSREKLPSKSSAPVFLSRSSSGYAVDCAAFMT
jgi:hypothetical protein